MTTTILVGDCRDVLRTLPDQSVHCVVTSPPYFGLRDYGTAKWNGGDAACDHKGTPLASSSSSLAGYTSENVKVRTHTMPQGRQCSKCGALRIDAQIGLEPTPAAFVAEMVAVFAEVRRVLRDDGTLWLNLGDSYAANRGRQVPDGKHVDVGNSLGSAVPSGLKPKDMIGIPWSVAFALRADGWYLRQDIIWSKPNPMPESVRDRCTKAHEYLFLLSKSERYHYDVEVIMEPAVQAGRVRSDKMGGNKGDDVHHSPGGVFTGSEKRNRRSVWEVATQPFAEAHFATFPPALIEPCILAGCPKGGTVLDPFGGAGTTGLVADRLGCDAILIELNPAYAEMARSRIRADLGRVQSDIPEPADAGGLLGWREQ